MGTICANDLSAIPWIDLEAISVEQHTHAARRGVATHRYNNVVSSHGAASTHVTRSEAPSSPTRNSELSMVESISQDWDLEHRAAIRASFDSNRFEGVRSSPINAGSQTTNRTSIDNNNSTVQQLEQELETVKTRYEHEVTELKDDLSEEQQKIREYPNSSNVRRRTWMKQSWNLGQHKSRIRDWKRRTNS